MKRYISALAVLFSSIAANGQIQAVSLVVQQQDQWCWAACSKCILNHYGYAVNQCDIAEYTRTVATWHSFGSTNCCTNALAGCNYWNYDWGHPGSIQDILVHFDNVNNAAVYSVLSTTQIAADMTANHLFVPHWAWTTGGGHFVVGYGISGSGAGASIYYMNPWPGEGLSIGSYTWMESGVNTMGDHTWDLTNEVTSYPHTAGVEQVSQIQGNDAIFPNPSMGIVSINGTKGSQVQIYNTTGEKVYDCQLTSNTVQVDLSALPKGLYIVKINSAEGSRIAKVVLQ